MALILLGQSLCPLCELLLLSGEDIFALPPTANTTHPLYEYFDVGFHRACFEQWPHREEAQAISRLDRQRYEASPEYQYMVSQFGKP